MITGASEKCYYRGGLERHLILKGLGPGQEITGVFRRGGSRGLRDDMEGMGGTLQGQDTEVCERTELVEKWQGCQCDPSGLGEEGEGGKEEFNNANSHPSLYFCS